MYYFALITSNYCEKAEMSLISFFHYNDVTLHLYVTDDGYDKVCSYFRPKYYFDKLDIIKYYSPEFNKAIYQLPTVNSMNQSIVTLNMYRVLDDVTDDEITRIDLDVLYFGKIDFSKHRHALCGTHEKTFPIGKPWHTPQFQINVGIAKFIKSKFNLERSFTDEMFKRMKEDGKWYYIPDQDILNELTDDKFATPDYIITADTNYNCNIKIKAVHYTSAAMKPWVLQTKEMIETFFTKPKVLGFLLYEKFAERTNLFLSETRDNIKKMQQCRPNDIYYTTVSNKKEFERLCGEINSWKI